MIKFYTPSLHIFQGVRKACTIGNFSKKILSFLFLSFLFLLIPNKISASHIVGGTLTYTYNGGNNYTVQLLLYRDCSGVAFPANAPITVLQADGTLFAPTRNFTLPGGAITSVPPTLPPCATTPSVVPCVEQRVYTATVNLAPSPGGMHLYYSVCCRNPSVNNITTPGTVGETFYAFIPCYKNVWAEDFTLPNGTTSDAGATAWTRTLGVTPPTSAQVNAGRYEVVGSNNGLAVWSSQVINISTYTTGVNLSVNADKAGANFVNNDTMNISYSLNGGPLVTFPTNGQLVGNWAAPRFATATALVGNTIQIFIRTKFNANNNSTGKTFYADMVSVYDNTFLPNSNPSFTSLPPLFFCATNPFSFNQGATDIDGDVLVYSMYTPYNNAPAPTFPNNVISVATVTWVGTYSALSPFNAGGPSVTLNAGTGLMTGVANTLGQFVFGVKVQEWRGGVLLSETTRDYEVNTVTCPPFVPPPPTAGSASPSGTNTPVCAGQNFTLTASTVAGATYSWTGPNSFTANVQNPVIVGATTLATGVYSVTATVAGCTGPAGTVAVTVNPIPASSTAGGNTPLCAGATLSLTATPVAGATYYWSGPNTFTAAVQNPTLVGVTVLASGIYSVTATVLGCSGASGTVNITVNPLPSAPTPGSNSPICAGANLNLTSTPIAGATYSWTGPNTFTSNVQNPTIVGASTLAAGVYSVNATVAGCPGPAGTVNVIINPAPAAPVAGSNSPLCAGSNINLTASLIAGATYSWTGPNTFTSNVQNPTVVGASTLAAGVYSVNATVAGCPGPSGTVAVVVNPSPAAPIAGSNSPLCAGSNINLTASLIAGATYSWTGPNTFTSNVQNPTIVGASTLAAGVYSVNATVAGCPGPSGTVNVIVNPIPASPVAGSNSPICAGQNINLTSNLIAGATYSWTGPNTFTSNVQNPTIVGASTLAAGTYSVRVTVAGCSGPFGTTNVVVNPAPAAPVAGSNSPLCAGSNINLTASLIAGATYSWTGPNTFTSNVQNPTIVGASTLATGVYSVSANLLGCPGPAGTVNVVVSTAPAAPVAGSNSPLCIGSTLNLTASAIAGATYNWVGPNSFTSTVQNPSIVGATGLATGVYSVNANVAGCAGPTGTVNVTVSPIPAAPVAASNAPLCSGQTLSLTASTIAGATYFWTGPNTFTSNVQNPTIVGASTLAAGVYSVRATVIGCPGPFGTTTIVVNASPVAPTAGGTATLCAGSNINLTASLIAGATYSWTGPNAFTSTLQNPTIIGASTLATGMYSVTATSAAGCTGPAGTFSVSVFGIPSPPTLGSNAPICTGQTLSLTATTIAGASYNWTGPNSFTSTAQNPTITNITLPAAGTYSVLVNVSGCGSAASTIVISVNSTPAAPVAGSNSPLCAGSNINLTASLIAGATYSWTGPNTFTSNVQNPTLVGATTLAAGVYSVNATVAGCPSANGTVNVIVNPIPASPVAGSNSPLCAGQTINLTGSAIAGATYNWTGPNTFTSNVQNPNIVGATVLASGVYSITATVLGCTGSAGTVNVIVNPIPAAPVSGNNAPLCVGQTLNLTASTIAGATYSWSGPNTFTSNVQNPSIINVTALAAGVYTVTANVSGCSSANSTNTVIVNPTPASPVAGSNSPLCIGGNINLTASPIAGATYNWTGPNSFTSTVQNPTIPGATTVAAGVYSVNATSAAGCTGPTGTVNVIVSTPAIVSAGANAVVCANNSTVVLNGTSTTGSGTWTSSGTGVFAPNNLTGNYLPSAADILAGSVTLTLTSTNNGGCTAVTNTMAVTITPAPTANAGVNQSLCANNATITLGGSFGIATGGIWSTSGTGTFNPNNTTMNANYIPSAADILAGSVIFTLTTTGNGNCFAVTDTVKIIFTPAPVVNAGPNLQYACKNNPNYNLTGTSTTGFGTWTTLGTGTFSPNNTILNPTYIASTADTTAGSVFIIFTSTNNGTCNSVTDTIKIIYTSTITINAGPNQTVCANNATVALTGTCTTGFGTWTSSGTGTFAPNNLTGNYIPSAADILSGSVTLTVTSGNNGTCNPIKSTMTVSFTPAPTANAGLNQTVCANNGTVTLNGSFTLATGGVWTSSGTGTFSPNNTNMNANYIPSTADTTAGSVLIFLNTTGNGNCLSVKDTMKITFTSAPLVLAGANIFVCKNNPNALLNGYSSTGTATWTTLGSGSFSPNNTILNPTYIPSTADTTAGSVLLILTSTNNGGCNPVNDTIKITYSAIPTVFAGLTQTVCANNSTVTLNGTSTTGSGTWTASGTGVFAPNTITGNYIPSAADILAGTVTLTLTSTNNGGCAAVTNTVMVAINPAPVSNAGLDQTICTNATSVALTGSFTIATGGIWTTSGTGTFSPNNTNMNTGYIPSAADTTAGSVMIFLTTTGNGNCNQVIDTMLITFNSAPLVDAGANLFICKNNPNVQLNGISSSATYTWTTLGTGIFNPNANVLNPNYTPSTADTTAGNVTLVLSSGGIGVCGIVNDTVKVSFQTQPKANFSFANKCVNSVTTFTDMSTAGTSTIVSWNWNFGGVSTSTVQNATHTFTATGTQTVTLVVSTGCKDSITKTVYINPLPTTSFTFATLCHDSAAFSGSGSVIPGTITGWNWNFGDTTFSSIQNPIHQYKDTGIFIVTLTVISDSGCVAGKKDTLHILACPDNPIVISNPAVPSGFSPNGDGKNDVLYVKGGPFNSLDFRIFNEWGNEIFRSNTQSTGWDGTFKSALQTAGRYIWTVSGEVINGRQVKMAGEVILTR